MNRNIHINVIHKMKDIESIRNKIIQLFPGLYVNIVALGDPRTDVRRLGTLVSEEELALLKLCMPEVKFNVKLYGAFSMIQITCDWREYLDYKLPEIEQLLNRKVSFKWMANDQGASYQVGEVTEDELNILRLCTNIDWWLYDPDRS